MTIRVRVSLYSALRVDRFSEAEVELPEGSALTSVHPESSNLARRYMWRPLLGLLKRQERFMCILKLSLSSKQSS